MTLFAMLWAAVVVVPVTTAQNNPQPAGFRADRILVKPKPGGDLAALHTALGTTVYRAYPAIGNLQVVHLPPDTSVSNMLARFQQSGLVQFAEPDYFVLAARAPNDPKFQDGSLWGLNKIAAPAAWDIITDANTKIVAVIDTGVDYSHPDLLVNMWSNPGETGLDANGNDKATNRIDDDGNGYVDDVHGINAINNSGNPYDDHGHGTHVSGIIGAYGDNNMGVVGVAWRVKIMACKFLTPYPVSSCVSARGSVSDAIECIDYARMNGASVINASWGDYLTGPRRSRHGPE